MSVENHPHALAQDGQDLKPNPWNQGASSSGNAARQRPSYTEALYKIHLDMHTPEWSDEILSRFDAHALLAPLASTGCRAAVVFAKDTYGNAYYKTSVGHRHRCMGDRDFLAEMLAAGHDLGMSLAVYYVAVMDNHAAQLHPDWRMKGPDGQPVADNVTVSGQARWQYLCHNSGFSDLSVKMMEEIAEHYDADAFHVDMFNYDFGGLTCYCKACEARFRDETGHELPRHPTWDDRWRMFLDFRYRSVERYMWRIRDAVHEHRPELPVIMNYHGAPGFDWRTGQKPVMHCLPSDMNTGETYTPMLGDMYPGMNTRFLMGLVPGKKVEVVSWRMNRITDFTTKPLVQLRWELFSSLAHGANVMLIDQTLHDGRVDEYPYRTTIKQVFEEIEAKRNYFGMPPLRHVGIYYSVKTRDFYGRDAQERFALPVMGAYKALVENHFDVGFIFDETVTLERLQEFPIVFLPNTAAMSGKEAALFREYVRGGGRLVSTFETSLFDEHGGRLSDFQLADVFGVHAGETLDCDATWLRGLPEPFGAGIDPSQFLLTLGRLQQVSLEEAQGFGDTHLPFHKIRVPERFYAHAMHPPHQRVNCAVFTRYFGEGMSIYLPHQVDAAYANTHEIPEHRKILGNVIRATGYVPMVSIEAPLNVESTVRRQGRRILVHLLAFNPIRQARTLPSLNRPIAPSLRMEENPLYRARITVSAPVQSVSAFNPETQLQQDGDAIALLCEDAHDIIIINI